MDIVALLLYLVISLLIKGGGIFVSGTLVHLWGSREFPLFIVWLIPCGSSSSILVCYFMWNVKIPKKANFFV